MDVHSETARHFPMPEEAECDDRREEAEEKMKLAYVEKMSDFMAVVLPPSI